MWKCHKCGKPVYFAERKQSLGYDWHPECLRCEECGKRLNPGQHAEHKSMPYCHVPCYGALFGPQLFGHGTRVESHKSYGVKAAQRPSTAGNGPALPRDHLESKLKVYNQFYDNKSLEIRSREVNNRLILEGALRVSWGVQGVIHLKEDDDQRMFVVRKRNSCRMSRAADDSTSDKENEISESCEGPVTTSEIDNMSTDISLSESMTFDTTSIHSLNEYNELPTTPEDVSANTTAGILNGDANGGNNHSNIENDTNTESSSTLCGNNADGGGDTMSTVTTSCASSTTLPSKLDKLEKLEWDEIDELLQVERRISDKDHIYETMPVKLPSSTSSATSSSDSSPSKTASPLDGTNSTNAATDVALPSTPNTESFGSNENSSASTSTDQFMTATASVTTTTEGITTTTTTTNAAETSTVTTTVDDEFQSTDDTTLKPMDFEDFKRSVHQDYLSGANSLQHHNENTLKKNQPIDPTRIHDSLKLYGENAVMSKSFNCEHALRSIDPLILNDTLTLKAGSDHSQHSAARAYALQKSGSATTAASAQNKSKQKHYRYGGRIFEKGINRSKSGPSCFDYTDSDDDDDDDDADDTTLRAHRVSNTVRRSDIPQRYIKIEMNCYPKKNNNNYNNNNNNNNNDAAEAEGESSRTDGPSLATNSGAVAGDELTQTTEDMVTASNGDHKTNGASGEDPPLHVTEDGVVLRRPPRSGASAIKRRSGNRRSRTKLKRRCSINGHFYNRETSFFTPPYGSQMSVWVTSLVNTQEVINLLLEKYKVDSPAENFSLFIIRDNGEQKRLKDTDYPLITRVMLGPHEDVQRLFLVDAKKTDEISNEVAQFLNLSIPECRAILERYDQELEREIGKVREKYAELRRRIASRMDSLKVHL